MHDVRMDFLTVKENESRENYGKTQSEYREYGKKRKEEKEYVEQRKEVPEELKNYLEYHHNYKTHPIISTGNDSNEIIQEYNTDLENYVNDHNREEKREIIKLLEQWTDEQPQQAKLARKTVNYIVKNLNKDMDEDELKAIFRVTTIAESLGTERKEIRRIYNKIIEDNPSLKDLSV